MSFSETQQFSEYEEARYRSPEKWEEAKGELVGGNTPQGSLDNPENTKENSETQKKSVLSVEEMSNQSERMQKKIELAVQNNPDWPPKSQNPESAEAEADNLEKSLNAIV